MVQLSNNPAYSILRIRFTKTGDLQYISHLDLVRTMHKIVVRSGLPLWYTEGFNPKPKMTFAAPLSIGTESLCELMDVRVTKKLDPSAVMEMLNANTTDEMRVTDAYYPDIPITKLAYLSYEIHVKALGDIDENLKKCAEALAAPRMEIIKKTKSGEAAVDIAPLVKKTDLSLSDGEIILTAVLSADPSAFLNPELLIKYLKEKTGILNGSSLLDEWYTILRKEVYGVDMNPFR